MSLSAERVRALAADLAAAFALTSAAQNRRRRLRIAHALLPVYRGLKQTLSESEADSGACGGSRVRAQTGVTAQAHALGA